MSARIAGTLCWQLCFYEFAILLLIFLKCRRIKNKQKDIDLSKNGNKIYAPSWFIKDFPPFELDGELWTKRNDFENREYLFILINLGFLVSVFFSFPVIFFGARNNFIALFKLTYEAIISKKEGTGKSLNPNLDSIAQIDTILKE